MDLEIILTKDFKVLSVCFRGKETTYNHYRPKEDVIIVINTWCRNMIRIEGDRTMLGYCFADFDHLIFFEDNTNSYYTVNLREENYVDIILQYLDWRKINYKVRNNV